MSFVRLNDPGLTGIDLVFAILADQSAMTRAYPNDLQRIVQMRRITVIMAVGVDNLEVWNLLRPPDVELYSVPHALRMVFGAVHGRRRFQRFGAANRMSPFFCVLSSIHYRTDAMGTVTNLKRS
jgi:hypothetical protein